MLVIRYVLSAVGIGFLLAAAGMLVWDLVQSFRARRRSPGSQAGADQTPEENREQPRALVLHRSMQFDCGPV